MRCAQLREVANENDLVRGFVLRKLVEEILDAIELLLISLNIAASRHYLNCIKQKLKNTFEVPKPVRWTSSVVAMPEKTWASFSSVSQSASRVYSLPLSNPGCGVHKDFFRWAWLTDAYMYAGRHVCMYV